jgi:TIR domain
VTDQPGRDFFISFTAVNRSWAEWIAVQPEAAGDSTVLQAWDFRPGSDFFHEMQQAATSASRRSSSALWVMVTDPGPACRSRRP